MQWASMVVGAAIMLVGVVAGSALTSNETPKPPPGWMAPIPDWYPSDKDKENDHN